ncbi:benzoate/H(+) symporter BenE family transporter [Alsobacter sp. SYSU M60028]|uniref:Benzoate/H(+) symporter BenE family transporter n=1 Tax=Alsobacter ponti TaxID=2962936 RepID=A0ABT1LCI8_9HYPH|nr:benzoate/H(+) symporter BenE family transporter [Alsobacter ponti]MCP8939225.1 benzoate/H(+) symporter BenE family transporter [Alsobacter ponti]
MRLSIPSSAVVAALVGFGGTLALIVAAARAAGADPAQVASWVTGLCLAMAFTSAWLSWRLRMPIVTAWSTPGAALIAASAAPVGMEAATGAFILVAVLILLTAAVRPLGDAVARIPAGVAAAMLAGVLLRFVLAVFETAQTSPMLALPLVALFLVARLVSPAGGMLFVVAAGIALAFGLGLVGPLPDGMLRLSTVTLTTPRFEPAVLVGLGLPLYLVTMASQNLPGFAVLRACGYQPPVRPILAVTGLASLLTAPLGAHTSNLAAITAAICTGPDTHPDPAKRWPVGLFYGFVYLVFAAFGASLVALFAAMPGDLVRVVAGLALLGPLMGALGAAMAQEKTRFAAVLTLVVTASGVTAFGVGSAFWGLAAGLAALGLERAATLLRRG